MSRFGDRTPSQPWTANQQARLARLWKEGVPTKDISAQLERSTDAVLKQAQRLGLEKRPIIKSVPLSVSPGARLPWTPERDVTAVRMWNEGASAIEIANALGGVTRNAVIGRMHRLGATHGKKAKEAQPAPAPKEKKNAPPSRGYAVGDVITVAADLPIPGPLRVIAVFPEPEPDLGSAAPEIEIALPTATRVTLFDLEPDSCRFPISGVGADTLFCGKMQRRGSSYCPECHALAWLKPSSNFQRAKWKGFPI